MKRGIIMQDFKTFETFDEILTHVNHASDAFRSSVDFSTMSEGTYEYIMTLMNGLAAINRIARIEIKKQHLQTKGDLK
jgi:2-hydroxy-3-keto-5-methylthiopentenyl-1-phosphate phosphatase